MYQSMRAGDSRGWAAGNPARGRCLLNCLEVFAEPKGTSQSPGPRGQRTTWNLLKCYRHRELHVEKPGRIGKTLLGGAGVVSFSLPASSLPPNLGLNRLGESGGNENPSPWQLPVNPPCWKHRPAEKG